jgi:uncharacterized surface protein with fasciclin (FAS1) repeats
MKRILLFVAFAVLTLGLTACPAETTTPEPEKIPAVATGNKDLSILVEALTKTNLVTALDGDGPFTVFAPTDAAFAALLTELGITKEQLLARADLADILKYHVVSGVAAKAASLTDGQEVTTLQGGKVTVAVSADKKVSLNNGRANVTTADVEASNGVIHIIDKVLTLPVAATKTYKATLAAAAGITSSGTGTVTATLEGKKLTVTGSFSGLAQIANNSHVHGADKKPIFNLIYPSATSGNLSGSGDLTDAQIADLDAGKLYANVHSAQAGGAGEIEGFLILEQ